MSDHEERVDAKSEAESLIANKSGKDGEDGERDVIYEWVIKHGVALLIVLAGLIRIKVASSSFCFQILKDRVELSTTMTSWASLQETWLLLKNAIPAYDYAPCRPVPLLVALLGGWQQQQWSGIFYGLADFITARLIWVMGEERGLPREMQLAIMAFYLLNPVTIMTSGGRSAASLLPPLLLGTLWQAQRGRGILAMLLLAMATYAFLYPLLLLIPTVMLLGRRGGVQNLAWFAIFLGLLFAVSHSYTGSWSWLQSSWGCCLLVSDLRPNVGLAWYLFVEMFDHFRPLFQAVFQLNTIFHVVPLCLQFQYPRSLLY